MDFKVASSIYRKPWLIESQSALAYLDLLEQVKAGTAKFEKPEATLIKLFANADVIVAPIDRWSAAEHPGYEGKTVAILPIVGAVMKEDYCGSFGTASLKNELSKINSVESVHTIIFLFDSPGGTVDGTETFANAIKSSNKETVALIAGICGSAAYWMASSASKIIATSKTDIIGSIGTMSSFYDRSTQMEEQGIVLREFYADASKDKNKMFRDAKQGKGRMLIEEYLNPTNDIFLSAVRENRGDKLNEKETLTGKTFLAEQAKEYGLIDEISSIDETINNLLKNKASTSMKIKSTFKNIMSLLGITAATEEVELTQEQLQKIDASLPELEQTKAKVTELEAAAATDKETITAITKERDAAKGSLTTAQAEVTRLTAEVERLGKLDAGSFSGTDAKEDKRDDSKEVDAMEMDFQKELNEKVG